MSFDTSIAERALAALLERGFDANTANNLLGSLAAVGVGLYDAQPDTLVVRWVDVRERAVPPEADTIIRTISRTSEGQTTSTTHWLQGLRGPAPR